jgi:serine carboxypeptidase-like clade 2
MSGETNSYVPLEGSRAWIESLNLPLQDPVVPIRQWKATHTQQIGGSVVEYKGLTRVSVRLAGHSLSAWQPYANRQLIQKFVEGNTLPRYSSAPGSGSRRMHMQGIMQLA